MLMRKICAVLVASFLLACPRDSTQEGATSAWSVDARPLLEIDTDDSLETIGNVNGVARMSDGRVAVGDQSNSVIRSYDATGKFIRSVGRAGSGPGEFEMFGEMLHCGDSLYAHDFSNQSFSVVSADGAFGRRVSIALPDPVRSTNRTVCSADGKFLTAGWDIEKQGMEKCGPTRGPIPFWISDGAGQFVASLGVNTSSEKWIAVTTGDMVVVGPRPLGKETFIALGKTKAYIGTADSGFINVYALDGTVLPSLRIVAPTPAVTSSDIEAFKLRDTIGTPAEYREMWLERMKEMKYPDKLPAYSALLVDTEENVWVRSYPSAAASEVTWSVFSEAGSPIAKIQLPRSLSVYEIGSTYIAGVDANPDTGKQRVLVLALRRTP